MWRKLGGLPRGLSCLDILGRVHKQLRHDEDLLSVQNVVGPECHGRTTGQGAPSRGVPNIVACSCISLRFARALWCCLAPADIPVAAAIALVRRAWRAVFRSVAQSPHPGGHAAVELRPTTAPRFSTTCNIRRFAVLATAPDPLSPSRHPHTPATATSRLAAGLALRVVSEEGELLEVALGAFPAPGRQTTPEQNSTGHCYMPVVVAEIPIWHCARYVVTGRRP